MNYLVVCDVLTVQNLPELNRVANIRLSGSALADCLMILEFTQNFKCALELGKGITFS